MSTDGGPPFVVGVTGGRRFDLGIERRVFQGFDVQLRPVDIETTDDAIDAFADVDAIIDRLLTAPYTTAVVESLANCAVIARCGIGVDRIDTETAAKRGIYVVNVPDYCQDEVAEHTLLLLLALTRNLVEYDSTLKVGVWERRVPDTEIHRLSSSTLGLVGFGSIARTVARKAQAFGVDVVASDPYVDESEMAPHGASKRTFERVLETADVVSVHAPLTEETRGLVDADAFRTMKETAVLINVSRGEIVVEDALIAALDGGEIAGAGLDVFETEPSGRRVPFESDLRNRDDVVLTPHVAWYSQEADRERRQQAARDVRRVLEGTRPENAVNRPDGVP